MAVTPKQERFVDEYLIDLNATQAAIRAGYSKKTAGAIGAENLTKPDIQELLTQRMADRTARIAAETNGLEITQDRVLKEYARLAFFDPRKLFDNTGKPLRITDLDDDTAAVVAGLDVVSISGDEDEIGQVNKYKLADKKGALDSVARHLGMFNDKLQISATMTLTDPQLDRRIADILAGVGKP